MGLDCRVEFNWLTDRDAVIDLWIEALRALRQHNVLPSTVYLTAKSKKAALQKPVDLCDAAQVHAVVSNAVSVKAWQEGIASEHLWYDAAGGGKISFDLWASRQHNFMILHSVQGSVNSLKAALSQLATAVPVSMRIVDLNDAQQ